MKSDTPRQSKIANLSLLYALGGFGIAALLLAVLPLGYLVEIPPGVYVLALGLGPVALTLYAAVGVCANLLAGLRVILARDRVQGLPQALIGLAANLLLGAPGALLAVSVSLLVLAISQGWIGFGNLGRPLRRFGRPCWGRFALRGVSLPRAFRPRSALAWLGSASAERSAVGAFERLARDLASHGAPPALVERCLQAAAQEQDHTERCLRLVERFSGLSLAPLPSPDAPRESPSEIAAHSLADGAAGEGFAAAIAAIAATRAGDPEIAELLSDIARDEAGHAALSVDILEWCVEAGGDTVLGALTAVEPAPLRPFPSRPVDGGLPIEEQRALHRRAWEQALGRRSSLMRARLSPHPSG